MNGKRNLEKIISPVNSELWQRIESTYGEIPDIIKIILEFNGFNSFLALKGIRYDNKNEFFSSLESTIDDILNSQDFKDEKKILNEFFPFNRKQFKLKPGHKNLIMNLMLEIDKVEADEFFSKSLSETKSSRPIDDEYIVEEYIEDHSDFFEHSFVLKVNNEDSEGTNETFLDSSRPKKKLTQKRKPDRMYNDEFLAQCINPRKRRVTSTKAYLDSDEGICKRFSDLIQQVIAYNCTIYY